MATAIGIEKTELRPALDELVASYAVEGRGMGNPRSGGRL